MYLLKVRKIKSGKYYVYRFQENGVDLSLGEVRDLVKENAEVSFEKMGNITDEEFNDAKQHVGIYERPLD